MLIFTKYVAKHELNPLKRFLNLDDVIDGAKKVTKGLATQIKPPRNPGNFRFFKVRIGKKNGARIIVFLVTETRKVVPVLIRLKKDKIFGMNMAINNAKVVEQINRNLDCILWDMKYKQYQEFEITD